MNLWQNFERKSNSDIKEGGIFFHYEKGIDPALRQKYISFSSWLRKTYVFPVTLNVYILNCEKVMLRNGAMAYGSFRWYPKRPPNIRVPSAIELELLDEYTKEEIYEQILSSLVHEITHYYQWALDLDQSNAVSERQANYYRYKILDTFDDAL